MENMHTDVRVERAELACSTAGSQFMGRSNVQDVRVKNKSNTVVIAGHVTLKLSSFYINLNGKGVRNDFSVREVRFY